MIKKRVLRTILLWQLGWVERNVVLLGQSGGVCEKEYPFRWELWKELMCNLKNPGIVGTYLQWAIWATIISLYKLLNNELWNWKYFILWGYELKLKNCHNSISGFKREVGVNWFFMVHSLDDINTSQFNVEMLLHFSLEFHKSWLLNMFLLSIFVDWALPSLSVIVVSCAYDHPLCVVRIIIKKKADKKKKKINTKG